MRNLQGKVAVITGAGSGIGRDTALALARAGTTVACCDIDPVAAKSTVGAIAATGANATAHEVDVSSEPDMRVLVDEVLRQHGVVDVVINNAGIAHAPVPTTDFEVERFHRVMDINFWGVVHGSLLFLPHLLTRPAANLVNMGSLSALMAFPREAAYTTSKFAVRGFTETLRMELVGTPVKVTLMCPGAAKTSIMAHSPVIDDAERMAIQHGFDSGWGRPAEAVAEAIVGAIRRDRPRAVTGPDARAVDAIARLLPGSHSRLLARSTKKYMDRIFGGVG